MISASKILLLDKNEQTLLALRDSIPGICYPGYWDLLGGVIEERESPLVALGRELFEEIDGFGLSDITELQYLERVTVGIDRANNHNEVANIYLFTGSLDVSIENIRLKDEGQALKFFSLDGAIGLEKFPIHYKKIIKSRFDLG